MLVALPAQAQKLSVGPITGAGAASVQKQLSEALCDSADCVPCGEVSSGGKPDWKKARRAGVSVFLAGAVAKKGKGEVLTLEVVTGPGKPKASKTFPMEGGTLWQRQVSDAAAMVSPFLKRGGGETAAEDGDRPVGRAKAPGDAPAPLRLSGDEPRALPAEDETPPPPPEAEGDGSAPRVMAWAGLAVLNRHFDYSGAASGNLRRYDLPIYPTPRLGVEVFPFVTQSGPLAGLGFEGALDVQAWLKSRKLNDPTEFPTSVVRADLGARWRFPVSSFFVVPRLGFRYQAFTVSPAASGAKLDGLPNLAYLGLRLGATVEGSVLEDTLRLWAGASALPVLSSGDVISPAFFNKGSNFGFEVNAGVAVHLTGPVWLAATGELTLNILSFQAQPTDVYVASGATDRYLGAGLSVRVEL